MQVQQKISPDVKGLVLFTALYGLTQNRWILNVEYAEDKDK